MPMRSDELHGTCTADCLLGQAPLANNPRGPASLLPMTPIYHELWDSRRFISALWGAARTLELTSWTDWLLGSTVRASEVRESPREGQEASWINLDDPAASMLDLLLAEQQGLHLWQRCLGSSWGASRNTDVWVLSQGRGWGRSLLLRYLALNSKDVGEADPSRRGCCSVTALPI
eukprot:CAMPEP_0117692630 /NCGR_PEP_ID=MMETSP0804-20121206/26432_1 /TAXON_ID=1074897 /ORGANISM="Tetraselmis astigmatica, Strain CCMP880" /LENGTH=174 /DNA_ID=CAMNT_0005506095 /DNA_START=228 /DNA_END=754 /DNA_ORIENTATION=+